MQDSITPLGLARQTTLSARMCEEALENAMILLNPEFYEYIEQAYIHHRQITAWRELARVRGWDVAERHASTMEVFTERLLNACQE
jgi:hypothetical protein